jgi:exopolysaccharide biosynthesis polyprenyl glycosylphosphotransferase
VTQEVREAPATDREEAAPGADVRTPVGDRPAAADATVAATVRDERTAELATESREAAAAQARAFARKTAARQWIFRTGPDRDKPLLRLTSEARSIREGDRPGAVLARDATFRRSLAVADMAAAGVALFAVIAAAGGTPRLTALGALPLMVLASKLSGLYDRDEHLLRKTTLEEAPALLQTATMCTLLAFLLDHRIAAGGLDKPEVVALWVMLFLALLAFRALARRVVLEFMSEERCLVLGDVTAAERIQEKFSVSHSMKATLVGRVRMTGDPRERGGPEELGPLGDLDYILRTHMIDRVIIAPNARDNDETLDTIRLVKALGVKVSVLPRLFEVVGSSVEFDDCDGITLLGVRRYGLSKSSYAIKRAFDITLASVGLALLAPLFLVVATAIKLTSRGPVFFRQPRIGRAGEQFAMFKFRTMYDGADRDKHTLFAMNEARGLFKIQNDPRVTSVGRLLRRCQLDELPQLINVVRGEMSLVGPRPLIAEEDSRIEGLNRRRLDVPPGMTGVWQVLGSSRRIPLEDMVKVDYMYGANWSLWLDIKILLRTVPLILMRRGC